MVAPDGSRVRTSPLHSAWGPRAALELRRRRRARASQARFSVAGAERLGRFFERYRQENGCGRANLSFWLGEREIGTEDTPVGLGLCRGDEIKVLEVEVLSDGDGEGGEAESGAGAPAPKGGEPEPEPEPPAAEAMTSGPEASIPPATPSPTPGAAPDRDRPPKRQRRISAAEARAAALRVGDLDGAEARARKAYVVGFERAFAYDDAGILDRSAEGVARIGRFAADPEVRSLAEACGGALALRPVTEFPSDRIDDATLGRLFGAFYPAYASSCRVLGVRVQSRYGLFRGD